METTLVLIRHAKPVETGDDPELSQEGRETQEHMATLLNGKGIRPDRILSSPARRAQETAEILSKELGGLRSVEPALSDPFDDTKLFNQLRQGETLLLVGHDPTLARFIHLLVGEPCFPSGLIKSSAVVVHFDGKPELGRGEVTAYYRPH